MAPKLHDQGGPIYNPRKTLTLFDRLAEGEIDLLKDSTLMRSIRRALVRDYPLEPKFRPGKYGKKYDSYTCANCGFGVTESFYKCCPNCGQALTDPYLGGRKSQEEQERYWED